MGRWRQRQMSSWKDRTTMNRRTLLAGAAAAVAGTSGMVAGISALTCGDAKPGGADPTSTTNDVAGAPASSPAPSRAASGAPSIRASRALLQVPQGMALVTSPRLPLFGVGGQEASDLLSGALPSW